MYYCIEVENVDPEKVNKNNGNKNALIYACENKKLELLKMMIDTF